MMNWIWPSGWGWEPRQHEYDQMIVGIYATLGVFLMIASRNPLEHKSLIWFTLWSSVVHGGIMAIQAIVDSTERINLIGDVAALFAVAVVLGISMPRGKIAADYLLRKNELPRCKQRGINRNIYHRSKGRGIKPLSASGGPTRSYF